MTKATADIQDALKISELFAKIPENDKNMALAYLSALRDKAIADGGLQEMAKTSRRA